MNRLVCLLAGAALTLPAQSAPAAPAAGLNPEHVVREWAAASRVIAPQGKSDHRRLLHTYGNQHNGHQIALICEFRGPVDADRLLERYRFTSAERDGDDILITAVPRDEVERLFVGHFEIGVAADTFLPAAIRFEGSRQPTAARPIALLNRWQREQIAQVESPAADRTPTVLRVASSQPADASVVQAAVTALSERRMPSVVGLPWQTVRAHLTAAGYVVRVQFQPAEDRNEPAGRVRDQFPRKGQPLAPGGTIILVVPESPPE
jgi:hypothetical protein